MTSNKAIYNDNTTIPQTKMKMLSPQDNGIYTLIYEIKLEYYSGGSKLE